MDGRAAAVLGSLVVTLVGGCLGATGPQTVVDGDQTLDPGQQQSWNFTAEGRPELSYETEAVQGGPYSVCLMRQSEVSSFHQGSNVSCLHRDSSVQQAMGSIQLRPGGYAFGLSCESAAETCLIRMTVTAESEVLG